jgi:hypothetical protein
LLAIDGRLRVALIVCAVQVPTEALHYNARSIEPCENLEDIARGSSDAIQRREIQHLNGISVSVRRWLRP